MDNTAPQIQETPITQAERMAVSYPPEGEKIVDVLGTPTGEVVVYDKDDAGNVVGWHKAPDGGTN